MAMSRSTFLLFALIYSWAFVGHSDLLSGGLGGASMPCIQKLMPCQPYLKGSSSPPATCCAPLKEIVADDAKCLCAVFNNPALLKSLNVTQESALALAKTCGANADTSLCKKGAAAPSGSHSTPASNSTSANSTTAAPAPKKSAATVVGGSLCVAAIIISSIIVSAF